MSIGRTLKITTNANNIIDLFSVNKINCILVFLKYLKLFIRSHGVNPITKVGLTGYQYDKEYMFEINGK